MIASVDVIPGLPEVIDWLAERTGLDFNGCHRKRMTATLHAAFVASGASDVESFADFLASEPELLQGLTDELTVGETYFMREPAHFELLRTTIVQERLAARPGPLRIWSGGCASGEEPYSIAIALEEAGLLAGATIVATDLSGAALSRARRAIYGKWSLRRCDDDQRSRWFRAVGTRFQLREQYRRSVRFRTAGLLDGPPGRSFDVVMCRNVLIYLTDDAIRAAAGIFHDALVPGGWLLAGASDPPLVHHGLARVSHGSGVAYRRVATADAASTQFAVSPASRTAPSTPPTAPRRAGRPATNAGRPASVDPSAAPNRRRTRAARGPREANSSTPPQGPVAVPPPSPDALDPQVRCLQAAAHLDRGRHGDAAEQASAALFLDPTLVAAHVVLAHASEHVDDLSAAARSYRNALALLTGSADTNVPVLDEPTDRVTHAVLEALSRVEAGP